MTKYLTLDIYHGNRGIDLAQWKARHVLWAIIINYRAGGRVSGSNHSAHNSGRNQPVDVPHHRVAHQAFAWAKARSHGREARAGAGGAGGGQGAAGRRALHAARHRPNHAPRQLREMRR